jgi:hypothetical protein
MRDVDLEPAEQEQPAKHSARVVLPPSPCDNCRLSKRCGAEQLVCEAFTMFVANEPAPRWRAAPRAPTRARWQAIFE